MVSRIHTEAVSREESKVGWAKCLVLSMTSCAIGWVMDHLWRGPTNLGQEKAVALKSEVLPLGAASLSEEGLSLFQKTNIVYQKALPNVMMLSCAGFMPKPSHSILAMGLLSLLPKTEAVPISHPKPLDSGSFTAYVSEDQYLVTIPLEEVDEITTVHVGQKPTDVLLIGDYAFVANFDSGTISILHVGDPRFAATLPVGTNPSLMFAAEHIYVANYGNDSVSLIGGPEPVVLGTIPVGRGPKAFGKSSNNYVYVANSIDNTVSVIDEQKNMVIGTINVGKNPCAIGSTLDGKFVFVVNSDDNTVTIFSSDSIYFTSTITVGNGPSGVALTQNYAYISNAKDNTISVIQLSDFTNIKTIPVGQGPCAILSTLNYLYVANSQDQTVSVINVSDNTLLKTLSLGANPIAIASDLTSDADQSHFVYVTTDDGNVAVIAVGSNTVVKKIKVGPSPVAIKVDVETFYPQYNASVVVLNQGDNTLSVIVDRALPADLFSVPLTEQMASVATSDGRKLFLGGKEALLGINAKDKSIFLKQPSSTTALSITPDDQYLFALTGVKLNVIKIADGTLVATMGDFPVSTDAVVPVFSPDGAYAYRLVTSWTNNTANISTIHNSDFTEVNTIPVVDISKRREMVTMKMSSRGDFICIGGGSLDIVTLVKTSDRSLLANVQLDGYVTYGLDLLKDGSQIYVSTLTSLMAINTADYSVSKILTFKGTMNDRVIASPDGAFVYLITDKLVVAIKTSDNTVVNHIEFDGSLVIDAKITPDGSYLGVITKDASGYYYSIRTSDGHIRKTIIQNSLSKIAILPS